MRRRLYFDYILLQLLYFIIMGIICGYGSYLLMHFGFSSSITGIIMSGACILSASLQPIIANFVDNSKKYNLFHVSCFISFMIVVLSVLTYFQTNANLQLAITYLCFNATFSCFEPLLNSVPSILTNNGYKVKFSVGRAVGSLGYALATAILGVLTAKLPYKIIVVMAIVVSVMLTIVCLSMSKNVNSVDTKITNNKVDNISYLQFLKKHKKFLLLMLLTIGIYYSFTMVDNMLYLVVENVGGTSKQQGLVMAFKAILEIPVIFFYDKIEKKFSAKTLLKIASVSFTLKAFLFYISKDINLIWLTQLTQITSLAIEIPAMVSYINSIMDKNEIVRGQALFVMSITIACILSGFSSGIIIEYYSVKTMLLVCFVVSLISSIIYPFVINRLD